MKSQGKLLESLGWGLGMACGLVAALLAALFIVQTGQLATGTLLVFTWLGILGLAGLWVSLRRLLGPLAGVFLLSFMPVGLYLLGASGWMRGLGAATLGYGVAAGLIWLARKGEGQ